MITIVGGGPAGSYLAYLLAKRGKEVTIVEEHSQIGNPVQCTGIVTPSIDKFVKLKQEVIVKRLTKVKVVMLNNEMTSPVDEVVMWRNKFDTFIAEMAADQGVKILTDHKFISMEKNKIKVKDKKHDKIKEIQSSTIVGADGPSSPVAKAAGISHNNNFYIGIQAKVKVKSDQETFETHFGSAFPDFFGWVVPESENTVRLGLGAKKDAQQHFYRFLKKVTGKKEILCWESGIIPIYNPKQMIQKENVYLIGDAATQVKATTGGGIIPSFKAAHTLCDCIVNNKKYQRSFKIHSGVELLLHLKLRGVLNKFKDSDYNKLAEIMKDHKVKRVLKKYDRDTPIPLLLNLMVKEPRFFSFVKVLFN